MRHHESRNSVATAYGISSSPAPAFLALVDGYALHRLARPRSREEEIDGLRRAMRALLVAEVMPAAEQQKWAEQLARPLAETPAKPRGQKKRA